MDARSHRAPASPRLRGLDGLRALAALAVVAHHYGGPWARYGLLGVELFFVLSGFVILMTLERDRPLAEFALARAARLYPAYWGSVALVGAFLLATGQTELRVVLWNATMLQGFLRVPDLVDPYWTLAYELWFYAVLAALVAARQLRNVDRIALAWLVVLIAGRSAMLVADRGGRLYQHPLLQLLLMPQFGHLFIAGMMLYRLETGRRGAATRWALLLAFAYSIFGRPDWAEVPPLVYLLANAAFLAAVWAAAGERVPLLASRPVVALGACSYSLYLLHVPVERILSHAFATLREEHWFHAAIVAPVALAAALLSHALLERPFQAWTRRRRAEAA
jgi:peptidoglycan/LPS O-acetylase OafA/YrhL